MSGSLIFAGTTLDELMDISDNPAEVSPAFGLVHHDAVENEYRWIVTFQPSDFPPVTPLGPGIGDMLYAQLTQRDLRSLSGVHRVGLDVRGWLFTGSGWTVKQPWPAREGHLSTHPDRKRVHSAIFLDQHTGDVTSRIQYVDDGTVERKTTAPPRAGWTPLTGGAVVAAMELTRRAAHQGSTGKDAPQCLR